MRTTFVLPTLIIALAAGSAVTGAQSTSADSALLAQGKQLVTTLCAACHSEQPPAKLAPPLAHVSRRYRMQHQGDRDKALERIVAWIKAPAKERSLMPAAAIERFGLMAPLPLPDDQLRAAAAYLWSLSDGAAAMPDMPGMQGEHGMKGMQNMKQGGHDMSKMRDTSVMKAMAPRRPVRPTDSIPR